MIKRFLFDHLDARQIIAKNTFWLAVAEFLSRFFKFFLIVFAARILGATDYGKFSFALAFASFFIVFADFGLDNILLRELARDKSQEAKFPAIFTLRVLLSLLMLVVIWLGSFFATEDLIIRQAIWILAFYIFFQSTKTVFHAFFQARQRMEYTAFIQILDAALITVLGFFVLFRFPSVANLSLAYVFVAFAGFILMLIILKKRIFRFPLFAFQPTVWKQFLAVSWPLGLVGFGGSIFNQIDSIALGFYKQVTQVGWYNAAYAIFGTTLLPVMVIGQSFFPMLAKAREESKERFQKIYYIQTEVSFFLAFGFLAGGLALAPKVIDFFYDLSYAPSILALQILLVASALWILSAPANTALVIFNQQRRLFWIVLASAFLNAGLDFLLIPRWSLYGPAFATVMATGFTAFLVMRQASNAFRLGDGRLLLKLIGSLLAAAATYVFLSLPQMSRLHVIPAILLGGFVYLALFLLWRIAVGKIAPKDRSVAEAESR